MHSTEDDQLLEEAVSAEKVLRNVLSELRSFFYVQRMGSASRLHK